MEHYYIQGSDGKFFAPGRHKRNYVDADGILYTVRAETDTRGQRIYQPCRLVNGVYQPYRLVNGVFQERAVAERYPTEQEAQAELDFYAITFGLKEKEDG